MKQLQQIRSVSALFELMGGITSVARLLSIGTSTASEMKRRGRIPSEYWRDLILAARNSGHPEITAELLVDLHARASPAPPAGFAENERPFAAEPRTRDLDIDQVEAGQFTRFRHLRRNRFRTLEEINDHINALRDEWSGR